MDMRKRCQTSALQEQFMGAVRRIRGERASDLSYAEFVLKDGKCPLLSETGLCTYQLQCGEAALSLVCRTFPRSIDAMPWGLEESSCATGCEAVLHLLYQRREGLGFILEDMSVEERSKKYFFHQEIPLCGQHEAARELCIDILQDRGLPLPRRLLLLGWVLQDLDKQMEGGEDAVIRYLTQRRALAASSEVRALIGAFQGNQQLFVLNNVKQLIQLAGADIRTEKLSKECFTALGLNSEGQNMVVELEGYRAAEEQFAAAYGDLDFFFENILVNAFFLMRLPTWGGLRDTWKNYMNFCNYYSGLRFLAICGCQGQGDYDRLIHVLTEASRNFLHTELRQVLFQKTLEEHGNTTLTDMAILVCG